MNNGFKRSPESQALNARARATATLTVKPTLRLSTFLLGPQFKKSSFFSLLKKPCTHFLYTPSFPGILYLPDPGGASVQLGQSPCYGAAPAPTLSQSDVMQHQRLLEIAQDLIFGRGMSLSSAFPPIFLPFCWWPFEAFFFCHFFSRLGVDMFFPSLRFTRGQLVGLASGYATRKAKAT